jgi:DNA-binding NtrC family response regulator
LRSIASGIEVPAVSLSVDGQSVFIGESAAFASVLRLIERLSACDAPVLINGETGTGKELAARSIHYLGARREAPFLPLNCGALPENLVESELFGHVRGAFTDAREAHHGLVMQAEGGTLFLDEIEALGPRGQVALLRFLQDLEYRPVGGSTPRSANVRVIAASNVDLSVLTRSGGFRQDLLFRLNVLVLELPSLRNRSDDVMLLAEAFVQRFAQRYGKRQLRLHPSSAGWLRSHDWPGNVRELENLVHREVLLADGDTVCLGPVRGPTTQILDRDPAARLTNSAFRQAKAHVVNEFERAYLTELLARTRGNVTQAARICGQERSRLNKLVRKHGLDRARFSQDGQSA